MCCDGMGGNPACHEGEHMYSCLLVSCMGTIHAAAAVQYPKDSPFIIVPGPGPDPFHTLQRVHDSYCI